MYYLAIDQHAKQLNVNIRDGGWPRWYEPCRRVRIAIDQVMKQPRNECLLVAPSVGNRRA
jgi:hypothetical protein